MDREIALYTLDALQDPRDAASLGQLQHREHGRERRRGSPRGDLRLSHLYVAAGAIVLQAIGLNPSKTIAALAERIADLIER